MSYVDNFTPPECRVSDMVLWHSDPMHPDNPAVGFIAARPGAKTVTVLVFGADGSVGVRQSCRHLNDPGLLENPQWRVWGAWEHAPATTLLRKFEQMMPAITAMLARQPANGAQHKKD